MSIYTTTIEIMVHNLCEDRTQPLQAQIKSARNKIFDFDYPVPNNLPYTDDFKEYFEIAFINKYLFNEIGQETVERFKQRLYSKCLELTPYYNMMFNIISKIDFNDIMDDINVKRETERTNNSISSNNSENNGESKTQSQTGSKSATSILPENMLNAGQIGNFTNVGYADTSEISRGNTENETETQSKTTTSSEQKTIEKYQETNKGRNKNQIEIVSSINKEFFNIFQDFLNEFKTLFMCIYY